MKKLLVLISSVLILSAAFTGCAMDKKGENTTNDQTLTPTSSMSEKVSEELTDASEKISEGLTDASEKLSEALTDASDNMTEDTTK